MKLNKYQTPITQELEDSLPKEVRDELFEFINSVDYIKSLISPNRPYAKDLNRDDLGRIIVDITSPHILEDMDYFRPVAIHYKNYGTVTNLRPNANPNSEYGKWIREEIRRCYDGYVRESDGEWVTGDMYFYLNYCPIIQSKVIKGTKRAERIVDMPEVWDGVYLRFHYMNQAKYGGMYNNYEGGQHGGEIAARGRGKAHPYSQKVLTPDGWVKWEDILIGSKLFGIDNSLTTVIDIPFDEECDIYKITLKDGREVYSSLNHSWNVYKHGWKEPHLRTLELKDIIKDYKKCRNISDRNPSGVEYIYSIPSNKGVEFDKRDTFVDPYTFGLLLGDGTFRHREYKNTVSFTSREDDMNIYSRYIPYNINKIKGRFGYSFNIENITEYLKSVGLFMQKSEGKFIPDEYKFNSREIRLSLLQGLMDTDGTVSGNKSVFSTVSKRLADDVAFISRSLGYNCKITKTKSGYKKDGMYIECQDSYNVFIYTKDYIFRLDRKLELLTKYKSNYAKSKNEKTRIVNIEYSHKEMAKCVTVDNNSHSYLIGDFIQTHNSYSAASILAKIFVLGEAYDANKKIRGLVTAYQKEYLNKDGTLNKFVDMIDFCAEYTQFPSRRLKNSLNEMEWKMGWHDLNTGVNKGTLNEVLGASSKDDVDKLRGKRSSRIIIEEFGNFPKFLDIYRVLIPSVQEGDIAFGQMYLIGTGGSEGANFSAANEIIYSPKGFNIYGLPNVYDKNSQGKSQSIFFYPAFLNRKGHYDKDGNSDVIGALVELLLNRYNVKYNSTDTMALTRTKAENPVTLQEAIMKRDSTIYPVADILDTIQDMDLNHGFHNSTMVAELEIDKSGVVKPRICNEQPIREFPHKDNKLFGACEIFKLPEVDSSGKVFSDRYIFGIDTYDDDVSDTLSLGSIQGLDLWTDQIVFEYSGRPKFADEFYEICRRALLMYNGRANYENNKKGLFSYFSKMNSLYLLTDTLEFLRDKDLVKGESYGNKIKGTGSTAPVKSYSRTCIRNWLLKPIKEQINEEEFISIPLLKKIKSRALLKELSLYNQDGNFDRHDSLAMLMLLREDKLRIFGDNPQEKQSVKDSDYLGNDPFFNKLNNNLI